MLISTSSPYSTHHTPFIFNPTPPILRSPLFLVGKINLGTQSQKNKLYLFNPGNPMFAQCLPNLTCQVHAFSVSDQPGTCAKFLLKKRTVYAV
jgi:hypothetical protein